MSDQQSQGAGVRGQAPTEAERWAQFWAILGRAAAERYLREVGNGDVEIGESDAPDAA